MLATILAAVTGVIGGVSEIWGSSLKNKNTLLSIEQLKVQAEIENDAQKRQILLTAMQAEQQKEKNANLAKIAGYVVAGLSMLLFGVFILRKSKLSNI